MHQAVERNRCSGITLDEDTRVADVPRHHWRESHRTGRIFPGDAGGDGQREALGARLHRFPMVSLFGHGLLQGFTFVHIVQRQLVIQVPRRFCATVLCNRSERQKWLNDWLCRTFLTLTKGGWVFTRYPQTRTTGYLVITSGLFSRPSRRSFK